MKSLKIFTICEICLANHLKAESIGVTEAISSLFVILMFSRSFSNLGLMNIFYQKALGRAQICLMIQKILGNSTEGNAIYLARKIPIFFVTKHYVMVSNFAKISIGACVNFRICRLLAIFPTVFSLRLTSFSGVEGLWILRVRLL